MIPHKYVGWFIERSEEVLDVRPTQVGRFAIDYLVPTLDANHDAAMINVIRKDLTRNLSRLQPAMFQDMRESVDAILGSNCNDGSWREVGLYDTMQKIIFRSINRVFFGLPLGHDQGYIRWSGAFAHWVGAGSIVVGQFLPPILKPSFGYPMAIPIYIAQRFSMSYLTPVFRQRLEDMRRMREDPSYVFEEPKDMISWMVAVVLDNPDATV